MLYVPYQIWILEEDPKLINDVSERAYGGPSPGRDPKSTFNAVVKARVSFSLFQSKNRQQKA